MSCPAGWNVGSQYGGGDGEWNYNSFYPSSTICCQSHVSPLPSLMSSHTLLTGTVARWTLGCVIWPLLITQPSAHLFYQLVQDYVRRNCDLWRSQPMYRYVKKVEGQVVCKLGKNVSVDSDFLSLSVDSIAKSTESRDRIVGLPTLVVWSHVVCYNAGSCNLFFDFFDISVLYHVSIILY